MIKAQIVISVQLCVLGIFIAIVNEYNNNTPADAHSFEPNSLSTFLELGHRADVELLLAKANFPSNMTLAIDHGERAVKLLNDVYRLDDDIVDDSDFNRKYNEAQNSKNTTVQALVVANIVDQILREYGRAFDIDYDLTNMSNMNMNMQNINMQNMNISNSDSAISSPLSCSSNEPFHSDVKGIQNNDNNTDIINFDNYQSAQKLSESVIQIFNNRLCPLTELTNNANKTAVIRIHDSLIDLKYLLNNKALAQDIMMLVHGNLHPSLQMAYNLKLKLKQ
ncbi:MAG TPA: hypothetical protein VJ225_01795 [Nitrososphaeraceae archaeon]|nr:hypothetical protein [Nitrososphaeraceae archaeon]